MKKSSSLTEAPSGAPPPTQQRLRPQSVQYGGATTPSVSSTDGVLPLVHKTENSPWASMAEGRRAFPRPSIPPPQPPVQREDEVEDLEHIPALHVPENQPQQAQQEQEPADRRLFSDPPSSASHDSSHPPNTSEELQPQHTQVPLPEEHHNDDGDEDVDVEAMPYSTVADEMEEDVVPAATPMPAAEQPPPPPLPSPPPPVELLQRASPPPQQQQQQQEKPQQLQEQALLPACEVGNAETVELADSEHPDLLQRRSRLSVYSGMQSSTNNNPRRAPSSGPPTPNARQKPEAMEVGEQMESRVDGAPTTAEMEELDEMPMPQRRMSERQLRPAGSSVAPTEHSTTRRSVRSHDRPPIAPVERRPNHQPLNVDVEELIPLSHSRPVDRFFVDCPDQHINRRAGADALDITDVVDDVDHQPRNEDEMLLERFAIYTDDDSFFTSGSTVIDDDPRGLVNGPLRNAAIATTHTTLQVRAYTGGRVPEELLRIGASRANWLYQIHRRDVALEHSSLFIFPARWMPRVVAYNLLHHWVMELIIFLAILAYSIFQACWARYTAPVGGMSKPQFMLWADVFFTMMLGVELLLRLFASGLVMHPRSFLRSPWRWLDLAVLILMILECTWWQQLWNFTAWRLIRGVKCLTYTRLPIRMKLLAKSVLRSTNRVLQLTIFFVYFIFFFGLLGLRLFKGELHSRCVSLATGAITDIVCRPESNGDFWFYWGNACSEGYTCMKGFSNPHYDFQNFDDVGHAMLSAFQIATNQGWAGLYDETSGGLAVMAILYYFFTILICAWIIPSLFLGIFIEKMEKTNHLYELKQIDRFDRMLGEQRQHINAKVRLRDFVERDDDGYVPHYPSYNNAEGRVPQNYACDYVDEQVNSIILKSTNNNGAVKAISQIPALQFTVDEESLRKPIGNTRWTDEQRVQLHLSLTRQRDLIESSARGAADGDQAKTYITTTAPSLHSPRPVSGGDSVQRFALGGRIGEVQHHPSTHTIGASAVSQMPFAVRQESAAEGLRFYDQFMRPGEDEEEGGEAGAADVAAPPTILARPSIAEREGSHAAAGASAVSLISNPGDEVVLTKESAGVVPNQARLESARNSRTARRVRLPAEGEEGGDVPAGASTTRSKQSGAGGGGGGGRSGPTALLVNDPEGGDLHQASSFMERVHILQNMVHMATEGYPRILTLYLWEHKVMLHRYGLRPLTYTSAYEEEALRQLRRRRRGAAGGGKRMDLDDAENPRGLEQQDWKPMVRDSSVEMARDIREHAPITPLGYIMYLLIFLNGVFNAIRYDGQPDHWEDALFYITVVFSACFTVELLMRVFALGPTTFAADVLYLIEGTFVVLSLFQLGFSRANTISLFNWVRFLKLLRRIPCRPLRLVLRVLRRAAPDILYALIIFSMYMFMWLLLGMSFFGSRMGWINYAKSDYNTRGSFESFSYACYAIAQAFSVNRDEWLYLTWSGMRVRGGYTVMYFILTVLVAVVFRYLFIAIFTSAWQLEEAERAEEEAAVQSGEIISSTPSSRRGQLLHWFDFSVWRSFKHIHGGFKRRDVAPDEVYYLNEDMRRQLRLAEAFDRRVGSQSPEHGGAEDVDAEPSWDAGEAEHLSDVVEEERGLRYINIGGHLERQESAARADRRIDRAAAPSLQLGAAQLRFARQYHAVPALEVAPAPAAPAALRRAGEVPEVVGGRGGSVVPAQLPRLTRQTPGRLPSSAMAGSAHRSVEEEEDEEEEVMASQNRHDEDSSGWEHLLLPGPRLRFKNIIAPDGRRAFERCLDCNTHKQMPLRAPRGVMQRTPDQLHEEHCHMAAVRSSRQLVLKALLGYVRLQLEHAMPPTRELVETVLGQAWGCGMLLYDTIEHLACEDLPEEERTWHRMLETLELQQWLLGLHVGEEQVGRATLAYLLAHQKRQDQLLTRKMATAAVNSRGVPTTTGDGTLLDQSAEEDHWMNRSLFIFSPSNPVRVAVAKVVDATWFEALILIIIFAATICLACYVPRNAGNLDMGGSYNSNTYKALHVLDDIFTVCFVVEMLLKWVRMGVVLPRNTAYMWSLLNIFDCFIVIISIVSWADDDVKCRYLKALRLFRILGPLRYWESNHSMAEIARTLWESVPLLANVALIMLMNYVVWAIIFISMFSEKMYFCTSSKYATEATCVAAGHSWTHVVRNFRNFYESLLTTFEISTGAEWLDVMYSAVDSWSTTDAMRRNRHPYLGLVFVAYYYVSHLVLISLFISAVVYLYFLTRNAAEGASGVTLEHQVWIRMQNMVLTIAPRPQLLPMKSMLSRITHKVVCFWWFEFIMAILLLCNALTMSLEWYGMSHGQQVTLDVLQYIFIAAFTAEVVLRLVAHGKRCFTRISFCWDLLVTVLSYLQIILNSTSNHYMPFNVNVLRLLRLQRILVVVDLLPLPVATYFGLFQEILRASVPGLINISLIYILAVYVFAIVGMHLVGYVVPNGGFVDGTYNNFLTFVNSLVMVFRLSTLENWVAMMRGSMTRGYGSCTSSDGRCGTSNWVPIFFVPIVVLFYWMIITLYMAVVVDQYITSVRLRASIARLADLHRFRDVWAAKDRNATLVLPTSALPGLLEALRLPLGLSRKHNRVELLRLLREYNIPDRGGMMYYYDVLIPLARRVIAMAIHDSREMEGKQSYDLAWRLSERTMSSLPLAVSTDVFALTPYRYTTAAHFAAAYIQAAYRRNRAQRAAIIERSLKWRQSREACDELHLSYDGYGFGAYRLSGPDPREDGRDRGLLSVSRQRSMRSGSEQQQQQQNGEEEEADRSPATVLPRVYQSAIGDLSPEPKMFGPAAADPIRRHEKRAEKLRRDQRPPSSQPNVGEDANNIEAWMQGQEDPASVPTSRARSRPMAAEDDPLQPPLGTDPEVLRTSELNRRRSAWPQAASPSVEVPPSAEAH